MPEYLSPGVYVEETEIGGKPIEGVSTSTAGLLGETERGPTNLRLITGFGQYQRLYGKHAWKTQQEKARKSYLPYAIEGFFANGGKRCFVGRIVSGNSAKASAVLKGINFFAIGAGVWGNRIGVSIRRASTSKTEATDEIFKLVVFYWSDAPPEPVVDPSDPGQLRSADRREPTANEEFDNLSFKPDSADYYLKRLQGQSQLIEVSAGDNAPVPRTRRERLRSPESASETTPPSDAPPPISPGNPEGETRNIFPIQMLTGGQDGDEVNVEDYKGNENEDIPTGLAAFLVQDDISIVCVPNENGIAGLTDAIVGHCERMRDRFAILQAKEDAGEIGSLYPAEGKLDSKYAAFYYPWVKINDPMTNTPMLIPSGGHIAGIYARSDTERGVHKAPANERVRGATDVQFNVTKGEQEVLNPRGVNCIRSFTGRGILVWGARTISTDPLWKYVNVRRLFLFLEKSIERSTQWVVFEPNNERLWARVKQSVSDFLMQVWKDGALMGTTPEEAFFVKCDETTMTPNEIETGKLIILVGVAPARPAEFVIFRLAQWRSGSSITE